MLNGDDLYLTQIGRFDQAGKQTTYNPILYQFCIANNGVETRF